MKTLSLEISDRDFRQLAQLAKLRGITTEQLVREVLLESRTATAAETRFRRRAKRGAGKEVKGLSLLYKAAGIESGNLAAKVPNAETRAAMREVALVRRLSCVVDEVIADLDLYSPEKAEPSATKVTKR